MDGVYPAQSSALHTRNSFDTMNTIKDFGIIGYTTHSRTKVLPTALMGDCEMVSGWDPLCT